MLSFRAMNDILKIQNAYDQMSSEYDQLAARANYAVPPWLARTFPDSLKSNTIKALDLGCGSGNIGLQITQLNPQVELWGVDISEGMVEMARGKRIYKNLFVHNLNDSLKALPLPQFELVIGFGVFEFIENIGRLFSEISAMLQPEAHFLCSFQEWDPEDPHKPRKKLNGHGFTHFARSPKEIEHMCRNNKLQLQSIEKTEGYVSPSTGNSCPYLLVHIKK